MRLCRIYMKRQALPTAQEMEPLWAMRNFVNLDDIIVWRDKVGVRKGVTVDDVRVIFTEYPTPPHELIVSESNTQFSLQFLAVYYRTSLYPIFVNTRTMGTPPPLENGLDILDIRITGPGPDKQPDAGWLPLETDLLPTSVSPPSSPVTERRSISYYGSPGRK
jgi:hypothetical protein